MRVEASEVIDCLSNKLINKNKKKINANCFG